jgi:hypothetical protein
LTVSFIASGIGMSGRSENGGVSITSRRRALAIVEEQVAHRDQADELAASVDHVEVGDEAVRTMGRNASIASPTVISAANTASGASISWPMVPFGILAVALPLLGHFRGADEASRRRAPLSMSAEDRLHDRRVEQVSASTARGAGALETAARFVGRQGLDLRGERGACGGVGDTAFRRVLAAIVAAGPACQPWNGSAGRLEPRRCQMVEVGPAWFMV